MDKQEILAFSHQNSVVALMIHLFVELKIHWNSIFVQVVV